MSFLPQSGQIAAKRIDQMPKVESLIASAEIKPDPMSSCSVEHFLATIDAAGGTILLTSDELESLETGPGFTKAWQRDLVRIDAGGEWCEGGIVYLTKSGRSFFKAPRPSMPDETIVTRLLRWCSYLSR